MEWMSRWLKSPQMRRLAVAVSLTAAGAAVAASVVWAEFAQSDRLELAGVSSAEHVAATAAHQHARVARPEEAGARPGVRVDPSLPDAKEALRGVHSEAAEPPPTF